MKTNKLTTKSNKSEQKMDGSRNTQNGLTPIQEQTIIMLASGESVSAVAEKLSLARSTIYQWQESTAFKCFYNRQCKDIREHLENSLLCLYDDAIKAIRDSLKSSNESVKLNAAKWLVENIENMSIGESNVKEAIRNECKGLKWADDFFDSKRYMELLEENGIEDG